MKTTWMASCLVALLMLPGFSFAQKITLSAELTGNTGDGAYLALYLTNANGDYQKTLWISGKKSKYYKHLRAWARGSGLRVTEYDGLTGASVQSGRTLSVTADVPDSFIDAGYQIRIDSAVENNLEHRAEVIAPLTTEGVGKAVPGKGYVKSLTYTFP